MSAKTTLVALTEALAAVKITADTAAVDATAAAAAAAAAAGATQPSFSESSYDPEGTDHAPWIADWAAGRVVMFASLSNGTKTITDTFFIQTTEGLVLRIGNTADPVNHPNRHIAINDGSSDIAECAPGEFITLRRSNGAWVRVPGVVGGVYPAAPS